MSHFNDKVQRARIEEIRRKEEEDLAKILSDRYDLPYINLTAASVNSDALKLIPEGAARRAAAAAFDIRGGKVKLAILSPNNENLKGVLDSLNRTGYAITIYMASIESLKKAWDIYSEVSYAKETEAGVFDISNKDIARFIKQIQNIDGLEDLITSTLKTSTRYKISHILEIILAGSIALNSSDIHFEPEEKGVRLRFRIDGVLQDLLSFQHSTYKFLLSRIKLLSGLKLNIKEDAQDGRFSIKINDGNIEIRTSILPGEYGESIVLRVLNPKNIAVPFEKLGIEKNLFNIIEKEMKKPNGMILTTGPTGSGKTTTLYALLRKISTPGNKIITIEDPIEYHLSGISQTQVNEDKGYTFLQGLRSTLRQDPDAIMVGEIRDSETAGVAINSALTGHLVLSTLHTNNAAGVIPRLIDLGINPKIISSALNISLAQRLVRVLCEKCKTQDKPTEKEFAVIDNIIRSIKQKRSIPFDGKTIWRAGNEKEKICGACAGIGYRGRIGVFEGILTDECVEKIIAEGNTSERDLKKAADSQKLLTMKEDGIIKVLSGVTSLDELRRVVDLE